MPWAGENYDAYRPIESGSQAEVAIAFHVFEGIAHKEDLCYPDPALLGFVFE